MSAKMRLNIDVDAKRAAIMDEIEKDYADLHQRQQLPDGTSEVSRDSRNVLFVGPLKSGKTTLRHVLLDPTHLAEEFSLRSVSGTTSTYERNLCPSSTSRVSLNIVELPGHMISLTSDLSEINNECARLSIHEFHLILFCVSIEAGIDGYAVQSFKRLINHLGEDAIKDYLCLVITRCESKNDVQRQVLRNELMQDVMFKRITRCFGRGICFSGALNRDDWNRASEALHYQFQTIYDYRRTLLNLIELQIEPFRIGRPSLIVNTR